MSRPASPKQIAYLRHLGIRNAKGLSSEQASARIHKLHQRARRCWGKKLKDRVDSWETDRLFSHPELYKNEVVEFLEYQSDTFRRFVRSRVVGASEKLTKEKVSAVLRALTEDDPRWWIPAKSSVVFFERLSQMFPGCTDGPRPKRRSKQGGRRTGCLTVVVVAGLVILALAVAYWWRLR